MLTHTISHKDSQTLARRGQLDLFHGPVQTPAFMPVGTIGVVKTLLPDEVKALGADIILGNTYHLYLRPGCEAIKAAGGIRQWNKWPGSILTDSGGFQVFSLGGKYQKTTYSADEATAGLVKITEEGVHFTSHLDGSKHLFTPEKVIDIQLTIGSDIMMVLDECTEYPASRERAEKSMERTHRWAKRARDHFAKLRHGNSEIGGRHKLFGIVQGSTFQDLREKSVQAINQLDFDGIAVGGVSVGEGKDHMYQVMDWTSKLLPEEKPHYLMGIGEPEDIIRAVAYGYDMFDCVLPTRLGRYGVIWKAERKKGTEEYFDFEKWDMQAARFRTDNQPLDPDCGCPTCQAGYSRAFIGHLLRQREVVGIRLTTVHNLWTILQLMVIIRRSLEVGSFSTDFARFIP